MTGLLLEGTVRKPTCVIPIFRSCFVGAAISWLLALTAIPAAAQVAVAPYQLSVFANSVPGSYTQPDSIAVSKSGDAVFIGYGNGVAKDGSDGKKSTIVEYTLTGGIVRTFQVPGHNDGLKIDPETGLLWALQNEDGNPNLVVIAPSGGAQTNYVFGPTANGGGYDDIVFVKDKVFISASNPMKDPNTDPAIVSAELDGLFVEVKPVLAGNAIATDIPTGHKDTLNLQDPDSLTLTPDGDLLLDSQADQEIVIVHHPGQMSQKAFHLGVTSGGTPAEIDDTVFSRSGEGFILVSDLDANIVYAIHRAIWPGGVAYSAANVLGLVGKLDLETGNLTPVVTGLKNPRGMAFVRNQEEEGEDR
jgi:hypothetical protein